MKTQVKPKKQQNKFVVWLTTRSSYAKNKTINALMFFLAFFIIGGTNYFMMFHFFVPTFFILDFLIIIFLVSPIFFFKKTMFDRIYLPIIIVFISIFYTLNSCYHDYFGTVFSLKDIYWAFANMGQVTVHSDSISWKTMILDAGLCLFFVLAIILFNALWKFQPTKAELKLSRKRKVSFSLALLFGSIFCYEFSIQMWCVSERNKQVKDIDYVNYSPNYHFANLGMLSYYTQEARQMVLDKGASIDEIREYLTSVSALQDDYTGFFKNDLENPNIFVILIETGDEVMLNNDPAVAITITPNLYKLLNEGINCNRNSSYNHTNVSDVISITGSYPQYWLEHSGPFSTPFGLPNILGDRYDKYFMADLSQINDDYNTREFMSKFGFDHYLYHDEMVPELDPWRYEYTNFNPDSPFMEAIVQLLQNRTDSRPFYIQYPTIFMHMDQVLTPQNAHIYEDLETEFGAKLNSSGWINPFGSTGEAAARYRRYVLKTMDFDKGLGEIMDYLYTTGPESMKNTLLCVYGDHSWYERLPNSPTFAEILKDVHDSDNFKQYSTILGFYNPNLNTQFAIDYPDHKINKPTWPSVIVPTILDLMGETFNPRLYQGKSIFDPDYDENEVFYSHWRALYFNEHYASRDGYHITKIINDNGKQEDFLNKLKEWRLQTRIVDTIYKRNVFAYYDYEEFLPTNKRYW